ncbi:methylated-DNA--[protein]-cysteine S-methyltransferase [Lactobacillus sp. Sy-1]|uniref:methylated-DNA--[protein]-cysteine S-methyltransferase n=1 Tax=Lactobacillus sp. Sy-1 TaxID=2109645 RepID=UPI001C5BAAAB|nr:methylated-DNA--[protein]-cysteine S-methyltransferase [Lactobacillus sp. Sy-1]MBW1606147.1 methylated-DNA--[protein]-cysteine S-methyltransferase [Lactobacillus sp. Sy-1]
MQSLYHYQTPLGEVTMISDEHYLFGLWFTDQKYLGAGFDLGSIPINQSGPIKLAINWLTDYFNGDNPDVAMVPLSPQVTDFRNRVLRELIKVPYGQTATYKSISDSLQANQANKRNLSRAVGGAVGHNPIALIIPCHRIIGSNGKLTGYAGGIDRKRFLLALENTN